MLSRRLVSTYHKTYFRTLTRRPFPKFRGSARQARSHPDGQHVVSYFSRERSREIRETRNPHGRSCVRRASMSCGRRRACTFADAASRTSPLREVDVAVDTISKPASSGSVTGTVLTPPIGHDNHEGPRRIQPAILVGGPAPRRGDLRSARSDRRNARKWFWKMEGLITKTITSGGSGRSA